MARYDDTFVDRFLEPWNRHDVDGALALMTDDCVWEVTRGREPHGTLYTGQTAVRSAIVEAFKALLDVNYQPVRNSFGEDHRQVGDEISCRASSINQSLNRRTAGFCSVSDVATT